MLDGWNRPIPKGYLKGYLDLVFRKDGYYYVVDWKSNRLNGQASGFTAEGVRAGVPDLFLAVPAFGYNGLFIELKKPKGGRVSDKQTEFISELSEQGYRVTVCHGFIEAKQAIENYLMGGKADEEI